MIDQELASIIRFVLGAAPNVAPYYFDMPQDFAVPAVHFPPPEIEATGDTFLGYRFEYSWYIPVFATDSAGAHKIASSIAATLMASRRLVPLIDEKGGNTGRGLRLDDPAVKDLEDESVGGAAQLTLRWSSRRPYDAKVAQKMMEYTLNFNTPERR